MPSTLLNDIALRVSVYLKDDRETLALDPGAREFFILENSQLLRPLSILWYDPMGLEITPGEAKALETEYQALERGRSKRTNDRHLASQDSLFSDVLASRAVLCRRYVQLWYFTDQVHFSANEMVVKRSVDASESDALIWSSNGKRLLDPHDISRWEDLYQTGHLQNVSMMYM